MPIVEIGRAFRKLGTGDLLEVVADDPAFLADVTAWVEKMNQKIINVDKCESVTVIIEKVDNE